MISGGQRQRASPQPACSFPGPAFFMIRRAHRPPRPGRCRCPKVITWSIAAIRLRASLVITHTIADPQADRVPELRDEPSAKF